MANMPISLWQFFVIAWWGGDELASVRVYYGHTVTGLLICFGADNRVSHLCERSKGKNEHSFVRVDEMGRLGAGLRGYFT
ncbi:hypothetical protein BX666DRAFT_297471 [Dichotomocladium elegans]|nr:hypothetical protein BX666DRAFT_297471 [Dichotomocladium elegans]